MELIFIDTETTGLDFETHELLSVAWCVTDLEGLVIQPVCQRLFLPEVAPTPEVAAINGYSRVEWVARGAARFSIADAREIAAIVRGRYWCGSHPRFDRQFLEREHSFFEMEDDGQGGTRPAEGLELEPASGHLLDVPAMAWPLVVRRELENIRQGELTRRLLHREQEHGAAADVRDLVALYRKLLGMWETPSSFGRGGVAR